MNTTQLECFLEVANFLNFSRAAQRLNITQPAVSHQINTLENELGVKLFHRTSKSVRLTQEGYLFLQYAGEIVKLANISLSRMKEASREVPQRMVIGCRNTAELRLLRPALEQLRTARPEVLPVLRLIPFDAVENLLEEGAIQLMFSFRSSAPAKARFVELCRCPILCVCAPGHPLAARDSVTLEELQTAGRIAVCRPPVCPPDLFAAQTTAVGSRPTGEILFCDSQEALFPLAAAGYCFALLPDYPNTRQPELRYLPVLGADPLPFGAVYFPQKSGPFVRPFVELLRTCAEEDALASEAEKKD